MKLTTLVTGLILTATSCIPAQTYWSDNFDSYNPGSLCPQASCANALASGGWTGWDDLSTVAGIVTTGPARSAPNSLMISNGIDAIQPYSINDPTGYPTAGVWRLTAWQWIDSTTFTPGSGNHSFLVQNTYNHGGPYMWVIWLQASPSTMMQVDQIPGGTRVKTNRPVILDQWVEIAVDIDLDSDCLTIYYNGQVVSTGTYVVPATAGGSYGGPAAIGCLNLYSPTGTSVVYYDDISIVASVSQYQVNQPNASCTVNGLQGNACSPAVTVTGFGTVANVALTSPLVGNPFDAAITLAAVVPIGGGGISTPNGQLVNVNLWSPSLFWFNTNSPVMQVVPFPGTINIALTTPGAPLTASMQMLIVDASHPDSFSLSQAPQLNVQ